MAETDVVEGVPAAAEEEQEPVSNEVDVLSGEQAEQLENGNKRLREEAADEQEADEPSAKRALTGTEENGNNPEDQAAADPEPAADQTAELEPADNPGHNGTDEQAEAAEAQPAVIPALAAPKTETPPMNDTAHELVRNEDGTVSQVVEVAKHLVGKLIGKGGATISALQQSTGCSIQVDHQSFGDHKNVNLKGPEDNLNKAKEAIRQTLEAEPAGPGEGEVQLNVKCPPGLVGRIIGRGGETIRSLQAASGAHVVVDQNYPEGEERVINIKGAPDSAERAKKMCEELIKGEPGSAQAIIQKYTAGVTLTVKCPRNIIGRIIGKGGETIKGLQRKYSVSVQIDQNSDPMIITVSGPKQPAQACQGEIRAIMDETQQGPPGGYGGPGGFPGPRGPAFPGPRGPGFGGPPFGAMPYAAPPMAAPYGFSPAPAYGAYVTPAYGAYPAYGGPAAAASPYAGGYGGGYGAQPAAPAYGAGAAAGGGYGAGGGS